MVSGLLWSFEWGRKVVNDPVVYWGLSDVEKRQLRLPLAAEIFWVWEKIVEMTF